MPLELERWSGDDRRMWVYRCLSCGCEYLCRLQRGYPVPDVLKLASREEDSSELPGVVVEDSRDPLAAALAAARL